LSARSRVGTIAETRRDPGILKRLHLGCGPYRFAGFDNLDLETGHDLRLGLPGYADASCSLVYACHLLEHLTYAEGAKLLREVRRVLAPGGIVRLVVPDFRLFAEAYLAGDLRFARRYLALYYPNGVEPGSVAGEALDLGALAPLYIIARDWGHKALYDETVLAAALARAGFPEESIVRVGYNESRYMDRCQLDIRYADHSLFMEARR
jgi:SAM-dependent methyltransferase